MRRAYIESSSMLTTERVVHALKRGIVPVLFVLFLLWIQALPALAQVPMKIDSVGTSSHNSSVAQQASTKISAPSNANARSTSLGEPAKLPTPEKPKSAHKPATTQSTLDSIGTPVDSTKVASDTTAISPQSTGNSEAPIVLEDIVHFAAQDSIVLLGQNEVFFFGPGSVSYQTNKLNSNYMKMRVDSSEVFASYVLDSLGHPSAYPVFTDGTQEFESETIRYNYQTQKGYITGVLTQQGEGFLSGKESKRMPDNTMYLKGGSFTTCDNHANPHFCLYMTKAKVRPEKNIVTGPVYMVMGGVPLYLIGLPFGFFPFNEKRTSGIIMPSYGEEAERGFYLRGLGFYFAINDYVDLTLRSDLFTKGSWAVYADVNYRKRYKYSGHFNAGFVSTQKGDKHIPGDFSQSRDFNINWSHTQDPKVDPLRTFSASVNFSTSSYNHNSEDTRYDPDRHAQNTKGSSISYSRRFTSIPLTLSASFNIDQRSRDSTLSVTLPNLSISLSTIYPFKRKKRVGKEQWYEKISLSYNGLLRNSITTKENLILKSNLIKDWKNGMQHSIPISASFDLFNYIKLTPSFNYNARWYTQKVYRAYDDSLKRVVDADTTYGFYHVQDFNASVSLSTTLYGFYTPWSIFGNKVQMIRHRMTPSISISYRPDFGAPFWHYYETLQYVDDNGNPREEIYSPFQRGIFSPPGRGKQGLISFSVGNNLEMKVRNSRDSIGEGSKKISLIDQFDWRTSYNMAADSFQWSNISVSLALRFTNRFAIRLNGDFDPYLYDYSVDNNGTVRPYRVNKLRIAHGKGFGRLVGTGTGFNYTFNNETIDKIGAFFNRLFKKKSKEESEDEPSSRREAALPTSPMDDMGPTRGNPPDLKRRSRAALSRNAANIADLSELDEDRYVKQSIPWSFSVNYSMNLAWDRQNFNTEKKEYPYKLTHNLSFRGDIQPTKNWHFSFDANYNFDQKKITNMTLSVTRNMHCWQMSAYIVPVGIYKSYAVTIGVTSQILKDLKYDMSNAKNGASDYGSWY